MITREELCDNKFYFPVKITCWECFRVLFMFLAYKYERRAKDKMNGNLEFRTILLQYSRRSRIKVYDANSNGTKGVAFPGVSSSLRISHPALNQHLILEYKNGLQSFVMI